MSQRPSAEVGDNGGTDFSLGLLSIALVHGRAWMHGTAGFAMASPLTLTDASPIVCPPHASLSRHRRRAAAVRTDTGITNLVCIVAFRARSSRRTHSGAPVLRVLHLVWFT